MRITTIADAIATLEYLHKRALLCDRCGNKLATHEHAGSFHHRCLDCVSPHGRYTPYKVPNELEKRIVSALVRWNAENPSTEGGPNVGIVAGGEGTQ